MTKLTGWKRKAVLLVKSDKTLDAPHILAQYQDKGVAELKQTLITPTMVDMSLMSDRPRIRDLSQHLNQLKKEFVGQSELCFYQAILVVLLRRGYQPQATFAKFEQLWQQNTDYLCQHLNLRWLVSACDTFVDCDAGSSVRAAILMNVVTLINTLKVYETQQRLQLAASGSDPTPLSADQQRQLTDQHQPLYDGLTYFRLGTDDTLKNMRQRYQGFAAHDVLAATILLAVFDRLQHSSCQLPLPQCNRYTTIPPRNGGIIPYDDWLISYRLNC